MWRFSVFGENTAVIDEMGRQYSYARLEAEGALLVNSAKISRCLVFCMCTNEIGSLLGYVTFVNNRIVPVMLDKNLDRELLAALIENYKPDFLWLPSVNVGEFPGLDAVYSTWGYTLGKTRYANAFPLYDKLALLLTTSGSTGSPKRAKNP